MGTSLRSWFVVPDIRFIDNNDKNLNQVENSSNFVSKSFYNSSRRRGRCYRCKLFGHHRAECIVNLVRCGHCHQLHHKNVCRFSVSSSSEDAHLTSEPSSSPVIKDKHCSAGKTSVVSSDPLLLAKSNKIQLINSPFEPTGVKNSSCEWQKGLFFDEIMCNKAQSLDSIDSGNVSLV